MDAVTDFLDCPAYLNADGTVRCGLPAAVEDSYTLGSTDGPVTSVKIHCPAGHWFSGPVSALTVPRRHGGHRHRPRRQHAERPRGGPGTRVTALAETRVTTGPFRIMILGRAAGCGSRTGRGPR